MASIYRREGTRMIWGKWSDAVGNVQRGSMETEDEKEAQARADECERLAKPGPTPEAAPGELTVRGVVGIAKEPGEWLKARKQGKPLAWRDDLSRLTHHFFSTFGPRPLRGWRQTTEGGPSRTGPRA
jgi:hypothetical protein